MGHEREGVVKTDRACANSFLRSDVRRTRALLFDLDGVLLDSVPAYRRAWATWAGQYGIEEATIWADYHKRSCANANMCPRTTTG